MKDACSINIYDFDGTIYDGDSTIDFYLFCLKEYKSIIRFLPLQLWYGLLFKLKLKTKKQFKEKFFIFLIKVKDIEKTVEKFWDIHYKKIKLFYLNKSHDKDIIISASPEFLIKAIGKRLEVMDVIATKVSREGTIIGNNCYGEEKVVLFNNKYPTKCVNEVYTDSLSDLPIIRLAKKAYIVRKNDIKSYILESDVHK